MEIAIDTNVLNDTSFLKWLVNNKVKAYLSSVGYMELVYHILKKNASIDQMHSTIDSIGIVICPFDKKLAMISAKAAIGRWDFAENARDYAIGSVPKEKDIPFITSNKRDFGWLSEVHTPQEFMKQKLK